MGNKGSSSARQSIAVISSNNVQHHGNGRQKTLEKGIETDESSAEDHNEKVPVMNNFYRDIIVECFARAKSSNDVAARVMMRMCQMRDDFRAFMDGLSHEIKEVLKEALDDYLNSVIDNLNDAEKVKRLSLDYGGAHVPLRVMGFKPDFFALTADSIATEGAFLGGQATATAPTNTFKAWTLLVGVMFSSVRDGYYAELRKLRKQSPSVEDKPTGTPKSLRRMHATSSQESSASNPRIDEAAASTSLHGSFSQLSMDDPPRAPSPYPRSSVGNVMASLRGPKSAAIGYTHAHSCDTIAMSAASSGGSGSTTPNHVDRHDRHPRPHHSHDHLPGFSIVGRFAKNTSLDTTDNKRRQRIDDLLRKHNNTQQHKPLQQRRSSSANSLLFNPNKIMDDFMNDQLSFR